jgi:hypothetical protein
MNTTDLFTRNRIQTAIALANAIQIICRSSPPTFGDSPADLAAATNPLSFDEDKDSKLRRPTPFNNSKSSYLQKPKLFTLGGRASTGFFKRSN